MVLKGVWLCSILCFTGCVQPVEEEPPPDEWIELRAYEELTGAWRAVNRIALDLGDDWGLSPEGLACGYAVELIYPAYPAGDDAGGLESRIIIDFEPYVDFRAQAYINFLYPRGLPQGISRELFKESLWTGWKEQEKGDDVSFEGYKRTRRFFTPVPPGASYKNGDGEGPLFINTVGTKLKQTRPLSIDIDDENLFTGEGEFVFSLMTP
jgi:hypothetical protein